MVSEDLSSGRCPPASESGTAGFDATYIDDIVDGIISSTEKAVASGPPSLPSGNRELPALRSLHDLRNLGERGGEGGKTGQPEGALPPYAVVNFGNDRTVTLQEMIETIESVVGKKAVIDRQPEQPGDVPQTWADVSQARKLFGYQPKTSFREGIEAFVRWHREAGRLT